MNWWSMNFSELELLIISGSDGFSSRLLKLDPTMVSWGKNVDFLRSE